MVSREDLLKAGYTEEEVNYYLTNERRAPMGDVIDQFYYDFDSEGEKHCLSTL